MKSMINIQTSDGRSYSVNPKLADFSKLIRAILDGITFANSAADCCSFRYEGRSTAY